MPAFTINGDTVVKIGLWHGTVIKFKDGKRFKITKLNPVNVKMMDESGKDGYSVNRDFAETIIDEDQSWDAPAPKSEYEKYQEILAAGITLGTAVVLKSATHARKYPGTYVVIAMPNNGTLRMAKLGGDGGRYLKNFTAEDVRVIDPNKE